MRIYEIDKAIEELIANAVDPETGELALYNDALDQLQMERDAKVENLALYVKELTATANAMRDEEKNLAERRQAVERKAERLKQYLSYCLGNQKFETPKVACTFRKSEKVITDEDFILWAKIKAPCLLRKKFEVDKTEVKLALKRGEYIPNARLLESWNVSIK